MGGLESRTIIGQNQRHAVFGRAYILGKDHFGRLGNVMRF